VLIDLAFIIDMKFLLIVLGLLGLNEVMGQTAAQDRAARAR
jgi:hypothetical protein